MGSDEKSNVKPIRRSIHYWSLFRYATPMDCLLLLISLLSIIVRAASTPICLIIFSEMVAMLVDRNLGIGTTSKTYFISSFGGGKILLNATRKENMAELRNDSWSFGISMSIMAAVMFISGIIYVDIMNLVGVKIMATMRKQFFEATIRKDIGWHDVTSNQNFAVRMTDNMEKIRDGISEKLGHFCQLFVSVIITITISFVYGWKLTLVISAYIPIVLLSNYFVAKFQSKLTVREQDSYVNAGSLVEDVVGAIRTVIAFGGEKIEAERYDKYLVPAREASKRKGAFLGIGEAISKAMEFICCAVVCSYGVNLVLADRDKLEPEYTPAVILIAFLGIYVGADNIGRCSPYLDSFSMAMGSAIPIYEVIDSPTNIDPISTDGKTLNNELKGNIQFQDVVFRYPSRDGIIVLNGLNLNVIAGQTVALVGPSGCGKSTCLQLLQRFYDPLFGNVVLDDKDIRKYNISWLRSQIAVVGQEPVLFQGTIGENIRYGKPNATAKEVEAASIAAGAHAFIVKLPNSYETSISEKGVQLSGGQKQRIAIARALIQNPKILLLDEATSALDCHSEKLVQKALNAATVGRTTIVVSHRLSAIKDVDRIVFIHEGKAVEDGSHDDLMKLRGKYFDMVTAHELDDVSNVSQGDNPKQENHTLFWETHNNLNNNAVKPRFPITSRTASNKSNDKVETSQDEPKFISTFIRILKIARQEWCFLIIATTCSAIYGCAQPAFAFILGELYAALAETDPEEVLRRTAKLSILCMIIGFILGTACFVQTYLFNLSGVWLTTKLRSITFKAILAQEMGWFDDKNNSIGALSARLSGDAASVQGSIGYPLSGIIRALANFICCLLISFYFSWQIALVCICTAPFMVGSIVFEARFMAKSSILEKRILEETSRIATEAIANIRTVAGLCREPFLIEEYNKEVTKYGSQLRRRLRFRGLVNSSGWSIMYIGYAVSLTYGGLLCSEEKIEFQNIIKVADCMLYGLMILAWSLAFTPAFITALIAGHRLFQIVDRKPRMYHSNSYNNVATENIMKGITYSDVCFRYPSRPDVKVLNGLNLSVLQGKTVALVGASGCGKSTCIQLLMRYYDPDDGQICLDGHDIERDLAFRALRQRIGIVSQEPVLFEKSIAENIAYGDNSRDVSITEILDAAKLANAYAFVTALPNGFDTKLGTRGTQLSGGQKQRIAIARALVRNPQVLLLDEATSALDLQSERIVQSALDTACSGRTCIILAHRLTTIQNADLICVLQNGQIVEQGNHSKLLALDGIYAKLYYNSV